MKNQITKLFVTLKREAQISLLKELESSIKPLKKLTINEFAKKHYERYGTDIEFIYNERGDKNNLIVSAIIHTALGEFVGTGVSWAKAKENAAAQAIKRF